MSVASAESRDFVFYRGSLEMDSSIPTFKAISVSTRVGNSRCSNSFPCQQVFVFLNALLHSSLVAVRKKNKIWSFYLFLFTVIPQKIVPNFYNPWMDPHSYNLAISKLCRFHKEELI